MRDQYKLLSEKYEQVLNEAWPKPGEVLSPKDEQAIVDMFKQGMEQNIPEYTNAVKLADRMGLHHSTISRVLIKNGLGGLLKMGQKMLPGGEVGRGNQKHPPSQYKKIEELLNKQQYDDASGPYLYSTVTAALEINKMIEGPHGEEYKRKGWVPFVFGQRGVSKAVGNFYAKYISPELKQRRKEYGYYGADGRVIGGRFKGRSSSNQQATGELGINDPSYRAVMSRAQTINDPNA